MLCFAEIARKLRELYGPHCSVKSSESITWLDCFMTNILKFLQKTLAISESDSEPCGWRKQVHPVWIDFCFWNTMTDRWKRIRFHVFNSFYKESGLYLIWDGWDQLLTCFFVWFVSSIYNRLFDLVCLWDKSFSTGDVTLNCGMWINRKM